MDDATLTILAGIFEFGLFTTLIIISIQLRSTRHLLIPVLGAATPFCLFMLYGLVHHYFLNQSENNMYMAGFVMGFIPYILCSVAGLLLGLVTPREVGPIGRYFTGLILGPGAVAILLASL